MGLEWLQEGENRIGDSSSSTLSIVGGPDDWGTVYVHGDELRFVPASESGVNLDEEATKLLQFQQSYQAAAQLITVADTLFQTLLSAVRR